MEEAERRAAWVEWRTCQWNGRRYATRRRARERPSGIGLKPERHIAGLLDPQGGRHEHPLDLRGRRRQGPGHRGPQAHRRGSRASVALVRLRPGPLLQPDRRAGHGRPGLRPDRRSTTWSAPARPRRGASPGARRPTCAAQPGDPLRPIKAADHHRRTSATTGRTPPRR